LDLNIERFWNINTQQRQIGRKDKKFREEGERVRLGKIREARDVEEAKGEKSIETMVLVIF